LNLRWKMIQEAVKTQSAPTLLYEDLTLAQRVMRDMVTPETRSIEIDSRSTTHALLEWTSIYTPAIKDKIKHYSGERPLFETAHVDDEINNALSRRVNLKSGGYLIIDQTEALTSIDVNTGGFVGGRNFNDTIFKTNLEAAVAIARQLRIRNLGGIIIIDFIDMDNKEHQDAILAELQKALDKDRTKTTLNGFSQLGLVEMTRKRTRDSLSHQLCEPCPTCDAKGSVQTARTVCYNILREILREAKQFNPKEFRLIASQSIIDLFLEEESHYLATLGDFIGKPITLEVDTAYTQEMYDIVLM
ncbi:MAG: ribonuclease E/G, partial [Alcaligenaceae bacterium]|nr:ribonuclease E/G [Alcaligenaceae bacterium]